MSDESTFWVLEREGSHDPQAARQRLRGRKPPRSLNDPIQAAPFYQPDPGLKVAINTALAVDAPLLLTGEPGCGKTQVAYYLGWYFGLKVFPYQVRSNSTAEDMKYDFDAVAYLRSAQHKGVHRRRDFLRPKALWKAYEHAEGAVLLIDEIDKAPRDFPNDLLQELDTHRFRHPFEDRWVPHPDAGYPPPLVVITSNVERRLPDAFLRRCVYYQIDLTESLVRRVVDIRTGAGDFPRVDEALRKAALRRFWSLRGKSFPGLQPPPPLNKKPSTAELLVWLAVLGIRGVKAAQLADTVPHDRLPDLVTLIKDADDWKVFNRNDTAQ